MHCGIAIWQNGDLVKTLTVSAPGKKKGSDSERLIALKRKLETVFTDLYDAVPGSGNPVAKVAIETFGNHNSRFGASRMILCGQARAIVVAVADSYCEQIIDICKGNSPKEEAELVARQFGLPANTAKPGKQDSMAHERDAVFLGWLCKFDKKWG
jgi:hypothetical protein